MMWNYLISGLLVGATIVLFDGDPAHPDLGALWRLAADTDLDVLGVSALVPDVVSQGGARASAQPPAKRRQHRIATPRRRLPLGARRGRRGRAAGVDERRNRRVHRVRRRVAVAPGARR